MARDPEGGSQLTEGTAERRGQRSEELSRVGAGGAKELCISSKDQKSLGPRLRGDDESGVKVTGPGCDGDEYGILLSG